MLTKFASFAQNASRPGKELRCGLLMSRRSRCFIQKTCAPMNFTRENALGRRFQWDFRRKEVRTSSGIGTRHGVNPPHEKNVRRGAKAPGEKSAIICCHLSYLLMDDSGRGRGKKKQSKILDRELALWNRSRFTRRDRETRCEHVYRLLTHLHHASARKINPTDAYPNNVTCN